MTKPVLLDLFCGAGGAAKGYADAGFEVIGVDAVDQPHYPYTFHQSDALTVLNDKTWLLRIAAIHASPPCQRYSSMLNHGLSDRTRHPDTIAAVRHILKQTGKPYVIENVMGARQHLHSPILLCGTMFGLRVYRHRLFESNVLLFQPPHPKHVAKTAIAGCIPTAEQFYCPVGHMGDLGGSQQAMGINWMKTQREVAEAIPPAFTQWIGAQLLHYTERTDT